MLLILLNLIFFVGKTKAEQLKLLIKYDNNNYRYNYVQFNVHIILCVEPHRRKISNSIKEINETS